mmetsp:Transcript_11349/g.31958  ORF Transcript_11349/g.31958 Transcript_11349/m.31958 type:complete len:251 (+) Transcript_11349:848-1600(+)
MSSKSFGKSRLTPIATHRASSAASGPPPTRAQDGQRHGPAGERTSGASSLRRASVRQPSAIKLSTSASKSASTPSPCCKTSATRPKISSSVLAPFKAAAGILTTAPSSNSKLTAPVGRGPKSAAARHRAKLSRQKRCVSLAEQRSTLCVDVPGHERTRCTAARAGGREAEERPPALLEVPLCSMAPSVIAAAAAVAAAAVTGATLAAASQPWGEAGPGRARGRDVALPRCLATNPPANHPETPAKVQSGF